MSRKISLCACGQSAYAPEQNLNQPYNCVSKDGRIFFEGRGSENAEVVMISTNEIINKNGKSTGLKISKAYSTSMRAKDLPDFGSPVGNKNTISTLTKQLKSSFDLNSQDATTKQLLGAIGQPKMLFSETEDVGREIGHMVFTQKFAIIEATHTPKIKQPDGGHFRTEAQSQLFQCESGYATTCGDGCNAESEE